MLAGGNFEGNGGTGIFFRSLTFPLPSSFFSEQDAGGKQDEISNNSLWDSLLNVKVQL